jgi:hypothetical protein
LPYADWYISDMSIGLRCNFGVVGSFSALHATRREPPTIYVLGVAHDAEEDEDRERVHSPGVRLAFARGVITNEPR